MQKVRRAERIVAITKLLMDQPNHLFSLNYFSNLFGTAKSTISEDLAIIKEAVVNYGIGIIETLPGATGGVRYLPYRTTDQVREVVNELCKKLANPERFIPGGFLYMSDLLFSHQLMAQVGEIFATKFAAAKPDHILTVETKGIPLGLMTARAFNLPLVMVRRGSKVTEGSAVSINYVSGSSKRIQTMSLPRRALPQGARVLIMDDFMKAGGTARGMIDLVHEVGAQVVGTAVLVATAEPEEKMVQEYCSLVVLKKVNETTREIEVTPSRSV
jgi:purine operon repressor